MVRTLKDIIDYKTAPLVQWEPVIGEEPSAGKRKEDSLTHNAIISELWRMNAKNITGIIADEGRLELDIAAQNSKALYITHLTLPGVFAAAARHNHEAAVDADRPNAYRVRVTEDVDSVLPNNQDAVVMNMILGCLATHDDHENIHRMLTFAAGLLKPEGSLIIVRPNPEGGAFETYHCLTPACDLKAGGDYDFTVKGLEDFGAMKNLYTPDSFLKSALKKAGFEMGPTKPVSGKPHAMLTQAPFLMNACGMGCK